MILFQVCNSQDHLSVECHILVTINALFRTKSKLISFRDPGKLFFYL